MKHVFILFEANTILKTPLFLHWGADKLAWSGTRNGIFTVKSAYYFALNLKHAWENGSSKQELLLSSFWKTLWNL